MAKTLLQLRTLARQKANIENSQVVTDPELNTYINEQIKSLYDLVISVDASYYSTNDDFTLTSTAAGSTHALMATFYKMRGLVIFPDTERERPVFLRTFAERTVSPLGYTLDGNSIRIWPWQNAGQGPWRLYFVPKAPQLVADGDTLDVTLDNFDEYVTNGAALLCFAKRQMSPGVVPSLFARAEERVKTMNSMRASEPEQAPVMWAPGRRRGWYDDEF